MLALHLHASRKSLPDREDVSRGEIYLTTNRLPLVATGNAVDVPLNILQSPYMRPKLWGVALPNNGRRKSVRLAAGGLSGRALSTMTTEITDRV
jgi:hypothetical protein